MSKPPFLSSFTIAATLSIFFLFGCGPSQKEIAEQEKLESEARYAELQRRRDLATVTCNIMSYSKNSDSAMRIKEINTTRELLGEDLYLGSDDDIKISIEYGVCRELVLNNPDYFEILRSSMDAVREQQIEDEERRKASEEKRAKARKLEDEKNIKIWSENIKEVLNNYPIEATLTEIEFRIGYDKRETIKYNHTCENLEGLTFDTIFVFKNNLGEIRKLGDGSGSCPGSFGDTLRNNSWYEDFPEGVIDLFYEDKLPSIEVFESVYIELTGDINWSVYKDNFEDARTRRELQEILSKKTYNLGNNATFDPTIVKTRYQIYP